VQDCLTKAYGSTNPKNVVKAVMDGLSRLHSKDAIATRRGLDLGKTQVEEAIERGQAYLTVAATPGRAPAKAPVSQVKDQRGGPRKPRGRRKPDVPGAPPTGHEAAAGEGEPST
jgi:small subunit ribosomal protein S5